MSQFRSLQVDRTLTCEKGAIQRLTHFGVHAGGDQAKLKEDAGRFKNQQLGNAFCGDSKFISDNAQCIDILKKTDFENAFNAKCVGKKTCDFNMVAPAFFKSEEAIPAQCKQATTQVYIQAGCAFTTQE